tara:strand:+ start:34363 stop:35022 length:660 start_codon:yes stop_codon:yes gene_type:complete
LKTVKKIILVFLFVSFTSCFEKEVEIIETEEENILHKNSPLSALMSGVTSHNASFDDRIDDSDCFSLIFPYDILINEQITTILNIDDINLIDDTDEVELLFPVSIAFGDYETRVLENEVEFNTVSALCQNGELYNFNIECAEFVYPFSYAIYNTVSRNFDTSIIYSKKEAFQFLAGLKEDDIYKINYPLDIILYDTDHYIVNTNQFLHNHFVNASQVCD